MSKLYSFLFFIAVLAGAFPPLASATTYPLNQDLNFKIPTNLTNCNLTISYPNTTDLIQGQLMQDNKGYSNYTINKNLLVLGEYNYFSECGNGNFKITNNGYEATTGQGLFYIIVIIMILTFMYLTYYGAFALPYSNKKDIRGEVVEINWLKYLKVFCALAAYMFTLALVFVTWNLVYAYSDWYALTTWLHYLFRFMYVLALPALVLTFVLTLLRYVSDKRLLDFIKQMGGNGI